MSEHHLDLAMKPALYIFNPSPNMILNVSRYKISYWRERHSLVKEQFKKRSSCILLIISFDFPYGLKETNNRFHMICPKIKNKILISCALRYFIAATGHKNVIA